MIVALPRQRGWWMPEQWLALLVSTAVLLLAGWVLWQVPGSTRAAAVSPHSELRWVWRAPSMVAPPAERKPADPLPSPPAGPGPLQPALPLAVAPPARTVPVLPPGELAKRVQPPARLLDSQGRVQLPSSVTAGTVDARSQAERMFEREGVDPTRHRDEGLFERDLIAGTRQGRAERSIFGRDSQAARAREAPTVAYNPALHERPDDLAVAGSADAYLSAPIRQEPAPGRDGQASAALQPRVTAVQAALAACRPPPPALTALGRHMAALQAAETRWGNGSSPEERRHTLPMEIERQYTLARRALWQLEQTRGACSG